MNNNSLMRTQ